MANAVSDVGYPIVFDEQMGEYHLETKMVVDGTIHAGFHILHYCPWCGGKLPKSKRDKFFTTPSRAEEAAVKKSLKGTKDLSTIMDRIGPPSDEGSGGGQEDPWIKWIRYMDTWKTLVLIVGEHADGRISWVTHGQYLGPSDTSRRLP